MNVERTEIENTTRRVMSSDSNAGIWLAYLKFAHLFAKSLEPLGKPVFQAGVDGGLAGILKLGPGDDLAKMFRYLRLVRYGRGVFRRRVGRRIG